MIELDWANSSTEWVTSAPHHSPQALDFELPYYLRRFHINYIIFGNLFNNDENVSYNQTLGHVYIIKGIAKWSRLLIGGHWPLHLRTWYMYILEFRIERHRGLRDLTKTLQTKDESTLQMVHFYSKKVMYNKYHGMQEMKFLMILFDNLNHKQKVLECA